MTLLELLHLLRKHLVLMIVLPIIGATIAGVASLFLPDEYSTSASIFVLSRPEDESNDMVTQNDLSFGATIANDVIAILKSDRVRSDTANALASSGGTGAYKLDVTASSSNRVITVAVTSTDPKKATDVANALISSASRVAVEVMQIQSLNVIDPATAPTSPSGPRRTLYTMVGAMAGLFLAVAIIVIADAADTRIRSSAEVEELTELPVVGHFAVVERG